jgi:putative inorganic carbon (hco3(-)) transporter
MQTAALVDYSLAKRAPMTLISSATLAFLLAALVTNFDAVPVLAGVASAAAVFALGLCPEAAVVVIASVLYSNVAFILRSGGALSGAVPLVIPLLAAIPAAHHLIVCRERPRIDVVFLLMTWLLVARLFSSFGAEDVGFAFADLIQYAAEGLALYWLVLNIIRSLPTLRRVLWGVTLTAALLASLSGYQSLTGDYSRQFGGLAQRQLRHTGEDKPRLQKEAELRAAGVVVSDRAGGPFGDPNRYAQILLVALPFALYLFQCAPSRRGRLTAGIAAAVVLCGVMLTYSRGAAIALGLLLSLLCAWRYIRWLHAGLLAIVLVGGTVTLAPSYAARLATIVTAGTLVDPNEARDTDSAIRGRATEMLAALAVFRDHLFLGVGPGQYVPFYSQRYQLTQVTRYRTLAEPREAHNMFLQFGAENGVVGLAILCAMLTWLIGGLHRARRYWRGREPELSHLAAALLLSVVAYLGTSTFLHLAYERYFWFLLAMCGAGLRLLQLTARERVDALRPRPNAPARVS